MRTPGLGDRRLSSTSGVLPMASTMSPYVPPQGRLRSMGSTITSESVALAQHHEPTHRSGVALAIHGPDSQPYPYPVQSAQRAPRPAAQSHRASEAAGFPKRVE